MNIIYILSGTSMNGGATKSFINLLKDVCEAGNKTLVICPDKNGIYEYLNDNNIYGAKVQCIDYTYNVLPFIQSGKDFILFFPRLLKRIVKNRIAAKLLIKIAKNFNPDIIHSNTSVNNIGILAAKHLKIPHIWHIREYGWADFKMKVPFQNKMLKSPNNYTISITKDINKSKSLEDNPNSIVIYNGIITPDCFRFNNSFEQYFLYVGRITEKKGALTLLSAYNHYIESKPAIIWKLKFAGLVNNDFKEKMQSFCRSHGIEQYVEFLGEIDNISDLMYQSGVVVVPSYCEGFGRVLPEAMANGCLTIARNTGGSKEQYDNGLDFIGKEIGLRFNNIEELTNLLIEVSSKGKLYYIDMIYRSQQTVKHYYSIDTYSRNILNLYNKIIDFRK